MCIVCSACIKYLLYIEYLYLSNILKISNLVDLYQHEHKHGKNLDLDKSGELLRCEYCKNIRIFTMIILSIDKDRVTSIESIDRIDRTFY